MRNGVIAFRRDGTLALMNDEAYRIFALERSPGDVGRPYVDVLRERPPVIRVLSGVFELDHLPNRAELRLKELDRVIGYTLSQVKNDEGTAIGAVMFFKDLTQVEQLEERERLRERLVSLGEMAAGIAHELKNPLAGIEVMAGLLRRQVPTEGDAQSLLADIMSSSLWMSSRRPPTASSSAPEAISSSIAPARACIWAVLSSARWIAMPTSPISSEMPEKASLIRVWASAAV